MLEYNKNISTFLVWYTNFTIPGGRDASGKLFGKGIVEMENGDIVAGMFKVLFTISCKVVWLILLIDILEKLM